MDEFSDLEADVHERRNLLPDAAPAGVRQALVARGDAMGRPARAPAR